VDSRYYAVTYNRAVSWQALGKHVPAATNTQATIEVLLGSSNGNRIFYVVRADMLQGGSVEMQESLARTDRGLVCTVYILLQCETCKM
jgi:hypothetical protein